MSELTDYDLTVLKDCQMDWPNIAHDIAMFANPAPGATAFTEADIARSHNLTLDQFHGLLKLEPFRAMVIGEIKRVSEMGPQAGVRLRAESMAVALQERLFSQAMSGLLDDKLTIQLLGMLNKSAGLEQPPEVIAAQAPQQTVNIAFNIPKLKNNKLAHLVGQKQVNLIDAEGQ